MAFEQLSGNDKVRLQQFMDDGIAIKQRIADESEGLKDLAKTLATEFDVKPGVLMKALNIAFKQSMEAERETTTLIENILEATGRA
jgi:hypothetical protein